MTLPFEPVVPEPSEVSLPYWEGTRARQLTIQWCHSCDRGVHYPRAVCPSCGGRDLEWRPMSGRGRVHAHATHHPPRPPADGSDGRYVVALIELDEGVRMLADVVHIDPDAVAVDQAVQVVWHPLADGRALPLFEPHAEG